MIKNDGWQFLAGLFLGVFLLPFLVVPFLMTEEIVSFIQNFQTLIVGVLAIPPIWIGLRQLDVARKLEEDRRQRKFRASRAFLSQALSMTIQYLNDGKNHLEYLREQRKNPREEREEIVLPIMDRDVLPVFSDCIECGDDDLSKLLSKILNELQVFDARLRGVHEAIFSPPDNRRARQAQDYTLNAYVQHAAIIYAYTDRIFEFAREETEEPLDISKTSFEERNRTLRLMGYVQGRDNHLFYELDR